MPAATPCSTATVGFPRIGPKRELKTALEAHWAGKITQEELLSKAEDVEKLAWIAQADAGVDRIAVGDFNLYDQVLQFTDALGLVPKRFQGVARGPARMFAMARGSDGCPALDMTKLFDTNYHYNVPELTAGSKPDADLNTLLSSVKRGCSTLGSERVAAVVLGPVTYLHLAKIASSSTGSSSNGSLTSTCCSSNGSSSSSSAAAASASAKAQLLQALLPVYQSLLASIAATGCAEIQLHEPALTVQGDADLTALYKAAYPAVLSELQSSAVEVNLVTYFEDIGSSNYKFVTQLPGVHIISLDFTRGDSLALLQRHGFPSSKTLGAGVIDARSVWAADPQQLLPLLSSITTALSTSSSTSTSTSTSSPPKFRVQPSCSLAFVPYDLQVEAALLTRSPEVAGVLAFAVQKLQELKTVAAAAAAAGSVNAMQEHAEAWQAFRSAMHNNNNTVSSKSLEDRIKSLGGAVTAFKRAVPFAERVEMQLKDLPLLPTTTIGSFPQTAEVRRMRTQLKKGLITQEQYNQAVDLHIAHAIGVQEGLGLDIFVDGESNRTDMVEYFGLRLEGMQITEFGWVQSYGSRCVRPPIICGDVHRLTPLTLREYKVAQSLTSKPVKGMLTGPVTILNWSFVRADVDRKTQAFQLALALRHEIADLEAAGCKIIQVDEPALREGMPLVPRKKDAYLQWAVDAFLLATCGAAPATAIHTHMCYCEFVDCMPAILRLDADVNSIENSRSDNSTLEAFAAAGYQHLLGPGVYDIHSQVVPSVEDMVSKLRQFQRAFPLQRLVCNPDCGLKTRKWSEVLPALRNMVAAAAIVRAEAAAKANGASK